jgi:hypothetical protein
VPELTSIDSRTVKEGSRQAAIWPTARISLLWGGNAGSKPNIDYGPKNIRKACQGHDGDTTLKKREGPIHELNIFGF